MKRALIVILLMVVVAGGGFAVSRSSDESVMVESSIQAPVIDESIVTFDDCVAKFGSTDNPDFPDYPICYTDDGRTYVDFDEYTYLDCKKDGGEILTEGKSCRGEDGVVVLSLPSNVASYEECAEQYATALPNIEGPRKCRDVNGRLFKEGE